MRGYVVRRLVHGAFVLWAAVTLSFAVLHLVPGDPVSIMLGQGEGADVSNVSAAQVEALRASLGLDRPLPLQYLSYLWNAVHLDFGQSYSTGEPVTTMIARALPATVSLALLSLLIAVATGVGAAIAATLLPWAPARSLFLSTTVVGVSVPSFWIAILLIQLLSFRLGWFPAVGNDGLTSLVLPAVSLAIPTAGVLAQVLGKSIRTALGEPYILTARAKGAGRLRILLRHAIRNASIPTMTMIGMMVGGVLAGATITETIFARQGVGRITVDAINAHDFPVIQALVFFAGGLYVLVNLVVDLVYPKVDPRIVVRTAMA
ncbi:ABC transporter permease [Actinopolymorpha alba]|uniref:ABC transporter permease n=1 Tax=Actinopolymorpha alba TaxID=533267 RepID=UPI0003666173|nr:ABC transporter permease [Actinopolymorpha alba]